MCDGKRLLTCVQACKLICGPTCLPGVCVGMRVQRSVLGGSVASLKEIYGSKGYRPAARAKMPQRMQLQLAGRVAKVPGHMPGGDMSQGADRCACVPVRVCLCVRVGACVVCACVHACVRAFMHACVRAFMRACVHACVICDRTQMHVIGVCTGVIIELCCSTHAESQNLLDTCRVVSRTPTAWGRG